MSENQDGFWVRLDNGAGVLAESFVPDKGSVDEVQQDIHLTIISFGFLSPGDTIRIDAGHANDEPELEQI